MACQHYIPIYHRVPAGQTFLTRVSLSHHQEQPGPQLTLQTMTGKRESLWRGSRRFAMIQTQLPNVYRAFSHPSHPFHSVFKLTIE